MQEAEASKPSVEFLWAIAGTKSEQVLESGAATGQQEPLDRDSGVGQ